MTIALLASETSQLSEHANAKNIKSAEYEANSPQYAAHHYSENDIAPSYQTRDSMADSRKTMTNEDKTRNYDVN